jgi:hypothetical protein
MAISSGWQSLQQARSRPAAGVLQAARFLDTASDRRRRGQQRIADAALRAQATVPTLPDQELLSCVRNILKSTSMRAMGLSSAGGTTRPFSLAAAHEWCQLRACEEIQTVALHADCTRLRAKSARRACAHPGTNSRSEGAQCCVAVVRTSACIMPTTTNSSPSR